MARHEELGLKHHCETLVCHDGSNAVKISIEKLLDLRIGTGRSGEAAPRMDGFDFHANVIKVKWLAVPGYVSYKLQELKCSSLAVLLSSLRWIIRIRNK